MVIEYSKKSISELKNYVYALMNPETNKIFYIGRGKGNRGMQHLLNKKNKNSERQKEIDAIREKNLEPKLEILRYGMSTNEAKLVEATIIDTIGLSNLTNEIRGEDISHGRANWVDLNIQLGGKPLEIENIKEGVILFFCHKAFPYYNIYDSTRQFWKISEKKINLKINGKRHYKYAFGMRGNTVIEVFNILEWYPAGTTVSSRIFQSDNNKRWEFTGSYADDKIRKLYRNRLLYKSKNIPLVAVEIGFRYIN